MHHTNYTKIMPMYIFEHFEHLFYFQLSVLQKKWKKYTSIIFLNCCKTYKT
jgi:hypothetical protein